MDKLNLEEIAEMVEGKIKEKRNDAFADNVFIDSRLGKAHGVFFALSGTVTDGHNFIKSAVENGAVTVVVSRECESFGANVIMVEDTFKALQKMAKAYRERFNIPFISITGSSGKTTNKDLIACVLSQKYNVHKTIGNFNSSTGVPLTLFELRHENEISVIETSMNAPGEILGNADIVRPETAVITNIGTAHIEFLGSRENIFKAKSEVLTYLKKGDTAIVNGDDDLLAGLKSDVFDVVKVGTGNCDYKAFNISQDNGELSFSVLVKGQEQRFAFAYPGAHNVINCLLAIAVGEKYGLTSEQIQKGFSQFVPGSNRMQRETINGITLINDAYNANEGSFKAAMDYMCRIAKGRKVVVAGDMFELGSFSAEIHRKTGENAADFGIDLLLACGNNAENYKKGYISCGGKECVTFADKQKLAAELKNYLRIGDTVLFKASRGVKLEEVYNKLKENL